MKHFLSLYKNPFIRCKYIQSSAAIGVTGASATPPNTKKGQKKKKKNGMWLDEHSICHIQIGQLEFLESQALSAMLLTGSFSRFHTRNLCSSAPLMVSWLATQWRSNSNFRDVLKLCSGSESSERTGLLILPGGHTRYCRQNSPHSLKKNLVKMKTSAVISLVVM